MSTVKNISGNYTLTVNQGLGTVTINGNGDVIDGQHRVKAAIEAGVNCLPVFNTFNTLVCKVFIITP